MQLPASMELDASVVSQVLDKIITEELHCDNVTLNDRSTINTNPQVNRLESNKKIDGDDGIMNQMPLSFLSPKQTRKTLIPKNSPSATYIEKATYRKVMQSPDSISHFLQWCQEAHFLPCRIVEASGLGAHTALLQSNNFRKGSSRRLPLKSWMTNGAICPEPFLILDLLDEEIGRGSTACHEDRACFLQPSAMYQNIILTLVLGCHPDLDNAVWLMNVSYSKSVNGPYTTAIEEDRISAEVHHASIRATESCKYIKIVISAGSRACRTFSARAIAVCGSNDAFEANGAQLQIEVSPPQQQIQNDGVTLTPQGTPLAANNSKNEVLQRKRAMTRRPSNITAQLLSCRKKIVDCAAERRNVATVPEKENVILASERKPTIKAPPSKQHVETQNARLAKCYNWFSDTIEDMYPASISESVGELEMSPLNEYRNTDVQSAWRQSPLTNIYRCMEHCLCQCTSFAVGYFPSTDLAVDACLEQSFSFYVAVIVAEESAQISEVDVMKLLTEHRLSASRNLNMFCRVPGGFCCSTQCVSNPSKVEERQWFLVMCNTPKGCVHEIVEESFSVRSGLGGNDLKDDPSLFFGNLQCVMDLSSSFSILAPSLRKWTHFHPIRYYGDSKQTALAVVMNNDSRAPVCWDGLIFGACRVENISKILPSRSNSSHILGVTLQLHRPSFYTWEKKPRNCPQLILTDVHPLEALEQVDGCLATQAVVALAESIFFSSDSMAQTCASKLVVMISEPWTLLEKKVTELTQMMSTFGDQHMMYHEEINAFYSTILGLRRKVTSLCALHVLSTAFQRGWESVGLSVPSRLVSPPGNIPNTTTTWTRDYSLLFSLDEDAFMDTLSRWSYESPQSLVLFYSPFYETGNEGADYARRIPFSEKTVTAAFAHRIG